MKLDDVCVMLLAFVAVAVEGAKRTERANDRSIALFDHFDGE